MAAGSPKGQPPLSPKGDPIRKVRLTTRIKPGLLVRDGAADRGEMVRVDVFQKPSKKGTPEFFLVPIYPHQVFDEANWPEIPNKAIQAYKPEGEWPQMTAGFTFIWSLYPRCFVEVEKSDGTFIDGYFMGCDRTTGAISLSAHHLKEAEVRGIGARTLKSFRKVQVDRLGRRFDIPRETRTWRGAACT